MSFLISAGDGILWTSSVVITWIFLKGTINDSTLVSSECSFLRSLLVKIPINLSLKIKDDLRLEGDYVVFCYSLDSVIRIVYIEFSYWIYLISDIVVS